MFETRNDLPPTTRQAAIEMLNVRLADAIDLERQAQQAHWNVKGPNFVGLHELFDRVALQVREYADEIAERAVALGGVAKGTVQSGCAAVQPPRIPARGRWMAHARWIGAASIGDVRAWCTSRDR
jgi:starvation-inducible DNA-binding protein